MVNTKCVWIHVLICHWVWGLCSCVYVNNWICVSVWIYVWLYKYWCMIVWVCTYVCVCVGLDSLSVLWVCVLCNLNICVILHMWVEIYKYTCLNYHEGMMCKVVHKYVYVTWWLQVFLSLHVCTCLYECSFVFILEWFHSLSYLSRFVFANSMTLQYPNDSVRLLECLIINKMECLLITDFEMAK